MPGGNPVEFKPGKLMAGLSSDSAGAGNYIRKLDWRRVLDRDNRAEGYEWYRPNPTYNKLIQAIPPGSTEPITLISECVLGNGRIALIAGNSTTLWRYWGLEEPDYYDTEGNPASTYYDTENGQAYFSDGMEGWIQIGRGFNSNGLARRWEAVPVADYLCLNNGVDLPMTYNLQENQVYPIYELREQQIAAIGTIAAQDGILCCADIYQINDDSFLKLMAPITGAVNASVNTAGLVSVIAGTLFPSVPSQTMTGLTIFFSSGQQATVKSVDGSGNITVNSNGMAIASGPVTIENAAAYALFDCSQENYDNFQRYPWRFFPSMPSLPRRFGAAVPVSFTASPGYPDSGYGAMWGTLLYPVKSIPELINSNQAANHTQTSFVISGIGLAGGNLTANIIWTFSGITQTILLDQPAQTTQPAFSSVTEQGAFIEAADAQNSFAGVFEDLQDDDGAIIKMLTLRDQLVIYKETPVIFLTSYTGDLSTPFQFQKVPIANASQSLRYRNTLISGGGGYFGSYHLYAGESSFYKFDLFNMTPTTLPLLEECESIFFRNAQDRENCFCAENPRTSEIFFCFGTSLDGSDNALCYDYKYESVRTTAMPLSAAARARNPADRTYWFVMGMEDGSVKRYGIYDAPDEISGTITATLALVGSTPTVTASAAFFSPSHVGMTIRLGSGDKAVYAAVAEYVSPTQVTVYFWFLQGSAPSTTPQTFTMLPGMWHRDGHPYESILKSGLDAFGMAHGEKQLNEYVVFLASQSPNTPISIDFEAGVNPAERFSLQSATIIDPNNQNLVKPTLLEYYLGVTLTVNGMNDPISIVNQLFNIIPVNSHSFGRRPDGSRDEQIQKPKLIPIPLAVANGSLSPLYNETGGIISWPFWDPVLMQTVYVSISNGQIILNSQQ